MRRCGATDRADRVGDPITIGTAARRAGATVATARYYEQIGLLPPVHRSDSGQRCYDEATVRRLSFVRRCRDLGFTIEQVRQLVGLIDQPGRPCTEVRDVAAVHLSDVRDRLRTLRALQMSLSTLVSDCEAACAGGATVDCSILERLALPGTSTPAAQPAAGCCATPADPQADR